MTISKGIDKSVTQNFSHVAYILNISDHQMYIKCLCTDHRVYLIWISGDQAFIESIDA